MFTDEVQRRAGWLISISVLLVTIFVTPFNTLDPINVPKLWVLSAFSFALLAILLLKPAILFATKNRAVVLIGLSLVLAMSLALLFSNSPLTQQLFGTNGRNTGLLTYFSFVILFISAAISTNFSMAKIFVSLTCTAFGMNALYGFFQATGNDPIKWNNPYSPVIGTFGNPNFVASFLGMGIGFVLPFVISKSVKPKFRLMAIIYVVVALFDILKSDAQQGIIVSLISFGIVGFFWLRSKLTNIWPKLAYLALGVIGGVFALLGTLQKGPLSSLLYGPSVTYRGDYWTAGIEMFKANPIFGVGLDSYGDWYRASRTIEATLRRGPSVVTNAAHNVFIDIAATAGIFALLAYIAIIFLGFRASWKIIKRSNSFDPYVVALIAAWIGYLVQSTISINNIALGIWGFVLPGLLIAAERWLELAENKQLNKKQRVGVNDFSSMALTAGLVIGGVIGFLPFNADANFRYSLESGKQELVDTAIKKWPQDASRITYAANLFNQNKLDNKAQILAREAVSINPRQFDGWNLLFNSNLTQEAEKSKILKKLMELDPHNPDLAKLG